jgi:quercetin dioxygenase-like cupin family protein
MNPVVASDKLKRTEVRAEDDESVHWAGAFAVYGGHGTTASSTIVYEIEPGKWLGWHTDATEETQYIIAGTGELQMEDGSTYRVGPGSVFAIPTPVKHDLVNVGIETLRAVAFFAAAMFTQNFDNVMMPPKSHILGTPNREGWALTKRDAENKFRDARARGQTAGYPFGFGGSPGFAASPGLGGAPPGAPPGRSSSGAASISGSVNELE